MIDDTKKELQEEGDFALSCGKSANQKPGRGFCKRKI
jgi:hypothetical protein